MNPISEKAATETLAAWLDARGKFFFVCLIAGYAILHFLLRIAFSPVIGTDDVTQAIHAQILAWGYEFRQPPLYTWLQWGSDQLLGPGVRSHAFLKYLLLFLTYLFLYLIGLHVFRRRSTAVVAALSLWLTYPFAVSIHQGVTHSILLSAFIAASVYAFIRLERKPSLAGYAVLGIVLGLGIFSKYGFIAFAAAFLLAAASLPRFRRVMLDWRILVTAASILAIALLPLIWLVERQTQTAAAIAALGSEHAKAFPPYARAPDFLSLPSAVAQFLAPLWLFLLWFFPRALRKQPPAESPRHDYMRLLGRTLFISLAMLAVAILAGLIESAKPRWMHAFLLLFPLYFFARAENAYTEGVAKRGYLVTLASIPVIIIALWAGQTYLGPHLGKTTRFHAPYDLLTVHLRQTLPAPALIIAEDDYLGGNLRLGFPESRVIAATLSYRPPQPKDGMCLLIWSSAEDMGLPPAMEKFLADASSVPTNGIRTWHAYYRHSGKERLQVAYLTLPLEQCLGEATRRGLE